MAMSLPVHLLDELLDTFRNNSRDPQKSNSCDGMVRLAVSGKEPLLRFSSFVAHKIGARPTTNSMRLAHIDPEDGICDSVGFEIPCSYESLAVFSHFVRVFEHNTKLESLPNSLKENMTDLVFDHYYGDSLPIAAILKKLPLMEGLALRSCIPRFLTGVKNHTIRLRKLLRLQLSLNVAQFYEALTMKPKFPFPETSKFVMTVDKVPTKPLELRFPAVKKLCLNVTVTITVAIDSLLKFFKQLPLILRCFPNVDTHVIHIAFQHESTPQNVAHINELYRFLEIADFHRNINIEYKEQIQYDARFNSLPIINNLKTIGFKDNAEHDSLIVKVFPRVQLFHRIIVNSKMDESEEEEEYHSSDDDSVQTFSDHSWDEDEAISFYKKPDEV
uniref:F-box domain-containing protein n=1 Tax=Panagrellus redivivus TaxID=6233 RepID=A0A7E4ZX33_PANRE